jgi:hypothetical protein
VIFGRQAGIQLLHARYGGGTARKRSSDRRASRGTVDILDTDGIELAATAYRRDVDVQRRRLAGYEAQIISYGDRIAPPVHGRLNLASREGRGNFPTRP